MKGIKVIVPKEAKEEIKELKQPEITLDYIRELRRNGEGVKADELMIEFRNNINDEKRRALLDCYKKDRRIKKEAGYCVIICCKNKAREGKTLCNTCTEKKHKYDRGIRVSLPRARDAICYICSERGATDTGKIKGRLRVVCRSCNIEGLKKGTIRKVPFRQRYKKVK